MNKRYLSGIYQARSANILSVEVIDNLKKLNKNELLEYLKNDNYATGSKFNNIEEVLSQELINTRNEINTLTESNILGDIFYYKHDLTNVKIVYKSLVYNLEVKDSDLLGKYSIEDLTEFFKHDNNSFISNSTDLELLTQVKELEKSSIKNDLEAIELIYHNYYYDIVTKTFPELSIYFDTVNFINNLNNFLKIYSRNKDEEVLKQLLQKQTIFDNSDWLELLKVSEELIIEKLSLYYDGVLVEGLKEFFESNKIIKLNEGYTKILDNIMNNLSYDHNGIGSVYYYLHLKNNEIKTIRGLYYE